MSNNGSGSVGGVGPPQLSILDGRYFSTIKTEPGLNCIKIAAKCMLCPGDKTINGDNRTDGNFLKHLKRKHVAEHDEFVAFKQRKVAGPNQPDLKHLVTGVSFGGQRGLDRLVMKYIVNGMKPLSTVEEEEFRDLIFGAMKLASQQVPDVEQKKLDILSRKTLTSRIQACFNETKALITGKLIQAKHICLTADGWSSHGRAFIGITAHWIGKEYQREAVLLHFSRMTGTHSYDRIANELSAQMDQYGIKEKVVSITTDNGSNFVKAFKVFGSDYAAVVEEEEEMDEDLDADDPENVDDSDIVDMNQLLSSSQASGISLPPHIRCASHCLNLIASKDVLKVHNKDLFHKATGKCVKLWNLSTSPKCAEKIKAISKKNFKRPVPTRWNSFFDALGRLLEMKLNLSEICMALSVPEFSQKELEFLDNYHKIAAPVAFGLDLLQGEDKMFMGALLPTLMKMKSVLAKFQVTAPDCWKYAEAYISAINSRFEKVLELDADKPSPFIFGAMSHPFYKLRWLPKSYHDKLKLAFIEECRKFYSKPQQSEGANQLPSSSVTPLLDFSEFELEQDSIPTPINSNELEMEAIRFLGDPDTSLTILKDYPSVEAMFLRYNTALPSSAPVERVFSYAGLILSPRRCSLSDNMFQKLIYLKCNSVFKN